MPRKYISLLASMPRSDYITAQYKGLIVSKMGELFQSLMSSGSIKISCVFSLIIINYIWYGGI